MAEVKFFDTTITDAVVSTTGTVQTSFNLIPEGVTTSTRTGRKCTALALEGLFHISLPAVEQANAPSGDTVRAVFFVDHQANGGNAGVTDILSAADFQSPLNAFNTNRFTVLSDTSEDINYAAAGGGDYCGVQTSFDLSLPLHIPLEFSAGTGAIGELRSNNVGLLLISRNAEAGFRGIFRMPYTDL